MRAFIAFAPEGIPEIAKGDDLAEIIAGALEREGEALRGGDIVAVAHKIVSKAEGRIVDLSGVSAGEEALRYAELTGRDARLLEVILGEVAEVLHASPIGPFICRHRRGFVCANAGVDCSNSAPGQAILLPLDTNASAKALREELERRYGVSLGVIVCDTHGRALREGVIGVALGASGIGALKCYRGKPDRQGRALSTTMEAVADESRPVVVIRGLNMPDSPGAEALIRPAERDVLLCCGAKPRNTIK